MNTSDKNNIAEKHGEENLPSQYGGGLKSLIRAMQAAFFVLASVIVGMLIYYFTFGGYFEVQPTEYVLVFQFGEYKQKYEDGWHWVFPYPINTVIKVPRSRQTFVSQAFMPSAEKRAFSEAEGPAKPESLIPGKDGYVLSGDENIMHSAWTVIYRIVAPEKYYLKCLCPDDPGAADEVLRSATTNEPLGTRGPKTLLKDVFDSVILGVSASQKVDILYKNSAEFSGEVKSILVKKIETMDIGIEIDAVQLESSFPPAKTKGAFNEVIEAQQEKSSMVQEAEKYEVEEQNSAISASASLVAEAEAYKKRVVSDVVADGKSFEAILKEYRLNPGTMLVTLFSNCLAESVVSAGDKYILNSSVDGKSQEVRLKINPEAPEVKERKTPDKK